MRDTRWTRVVGPALAFSLALQAVTGLCMASFYAPSSTTAWAAVAYIQQEVTLGWFIRGLHSVGRQHDGGAGRRCTSCNRSRSGSYATALRRNWILGLALGALVLAFALTGYLLPWDQKGYWATQVATSLLGETPFVGDYLRRIVQGGGDYGNLTLTHFYALHTMLLPAVTTTLVVLHVRWTRRAERVVARRRLARRARVRARPRRLVHARRALAWRAARGAGGSGVGLRRASRVVLLAALSAAEVSARSHRSRRRARAAAPRRWAAVGAAARAARAGDRDRARARRRRGRAHAARAPRRSRTTSRISAAARAPKSTPGARSTLARLGVPPAGGLAVYDNDPMLRARKLFDAQAARAATCSTAPAKRRGPF